MQRRLFSLITWAGGRNNPEWNDDAGVAVLGRVDAEENHSQQQEQSQDGQAQKLQDDPG